MTSLRDNIIILFIYFVCSVNLFAAASILKIKPVNDTKSLFDDFEFDLEDASIVEMDHEITIDYKYEEPSDFLGTIGVSTCFAVAFRAEKKISKKCAHKSKPIIGLYHWSGRSKGQTLDAATLEVVNWIKFNTKEDWMLSIVIFGGEANSKRDGQALKKALKKHFKQAHFQTRFFFNTPMESNDSWDVVVTANHFFFGPSLFSEVTP